MGKALPIDVEVARATFTYDPELGEIRRIFDGQKPKLTVHGKGYLYVRMKGKDVPVNRLCFVLHTGRNPEGVVDHIDGDKTNHRWSNLRDVDQRINCLNTTRHRGVYPHGRKWVARFQRKYLGLFPSEQAAMDAYNEARIKQLNERLEERQCHSTYQTPS